MALRILRHLQATDVLQRHKEDLQDRVRVELAPDQFAVTDLALAVASWPERAGWLRPEGVPVLAQDDPPPAFPVYQDTADPRISAGPWSAGWPALPEGTRRELHDFVGALRSVIVGQAQELEEAGVPVDPGSPCDLSFLVQLALLDLRGTPEEIVDALNLSPPYSLSSDGRGVRNVRDGTNEQVERAASAVRRWWRSQQEDDRSHTLRDRGGRPEGSRTRGSDTGLLYEYVPVLLEDFPGASASALIRQWQRNTKGSAGVRLRDLMGKHVGDPAPSPRTLQRILKELRQ